MYDIYHMNDYVWASIEPLGAREKYWFIQEDSKFQNDSEFQNDSKLLFKLGKYNQNEIWVEKVVSEIFKYIKIPCARYEFADWDHNGAKKLGILSESVVPKDANLVHGNMLLFRASRDYPKDNNKYYSIREYKLSTVLTLLKLLCIMYKLSPPLTISSDLSFVRTGLDMFLVYIMLDMLVANQDRHHENWGVISNKDSLCLAETYDHGSSLASQMKDDERIKRLSTKDMRYDITSFASKAQSAFFDDMGKRLRMHDAVSMTLKFIKKDNDDLQKHCVDIFSSITEKVIVNIFEKIPDNIVSDVSRDFSIKLLMNNRSELLKLLKES